MNPLWYILAFIIIVTALQVTVEMVVKGKARKNYEEQRRKETPVIFQGIKLPLMKNKRGFTIVDSNKLQEEDPILWSEWRHSKGVSDKDIIRELESRMLSTSDRDFAIKLKSVADTYKSYANIKYALHYHSKRIKKITLQLSEAPDQALSDIISEEREQILLEYRTFLKTFNAPNEFYDSVFIFKLSDEKDLDILLNSAGISVRTLIAYK